MLGTAPSGSVQLQDYCVRPEKIGEPFFQSLSAFASDPRRRANAPVNTYSALSSRWRGLSVSDVRTCPTPYALDALAQPSNRILAPRPFHQEDQPTVVPGRLEMVESNPSISVAKIRRKLVLYPFSCSNLGIIPIFRGKT